MIVQAELGDWHTQREGKHGSGQGWATAPSHCSSSLEGGKGAFSHKKCSLEFVRDGEQSDTTTASRTIDEK
jgi:hypothetical protein